MLIVYVLLILDSGYVFVFIYRNKTDEVCFGVMFFGTVKFFVCVCYRQSSCLFDGDTCNVLRAPASHTTCCYRQSNCLFDRDIDNVLQCPQ